MASDGLNLGEKYASAVQKLARIHNGRNNPNLCPKERSRMEEELRIARAYFQDLLRSAKTSE